MSRARATGTAAAAVAAGACLAACYVIASDLGVVIGGTVIATAALLAVRAVAPRPLRRAARRPAAPAPDPAAGFPAYRRIAAELGWAGVSRRHYDHSARPMLGRLLAAVLAERHRIDIARQPDEARRLFGADLYPLIDPAQPKSQDNTAPGVDHATLSRIIDRLEEL